MNEDICWYIEQLRNKKMEIILLEREIDNRKILFNKSIESLIDNINRIKKELCVLSERKILIRLDDLLNELAFLSGIKVSDIYVNIEIDISFYGKHNMLEMLKLIKNKDVKICRTNNMNMMLDLFGCNEEYLDTLEPVFEYYVILPIDLEEYQFDGRKLIDYCSIKYDYDERGVYTKMIINKNINDLVCNFNLGYLDNVDDNWEPANLFLQAIINCVERDNNLVRKK